MAQGTPLGLESISASKRIDPTPGAVFVCGIALNIDQVLDLFDLLFLLRIDAETQEERLLAYDTGHPPAAVRPFDNRSETVALSSTRRCSNSAQSLSTE
jgi:hypothetical protein